MSEEEAYEEIMNDTAKFVEEEHICKDCWLQIYELSDGSMASIGAFGYERWLDESPTGVEVWTHN